MRAVSVDRKVIRFVIHDEETEPTAQDPATFESPNLADALTAFENHSAYPLGTAPGMFAPRHASKEEPNVGR